MLADAARATMTPVSSAMRLSSGAPLYGPTRGGTGRPADPQTRRPADPQTRRPGLTEFAASTWYDGLGRAARVGARVHSSFSSQVGTGPSRIHEMKVQDMTAETLLTSHDPDGGDPGKGAPDTDDPAGKDPTRDGPSARDTYETVRTFESLGVDESLTKILADQGITTAFPIQALTIADALAGRDVCGKAKTGSGKTLAFGLPLLQRLTAPSLDTQHPHVPSLDTQHPHVPSPGAPHADPAQRATRRPPSAKAASTRPARPRALVLLPTRELAVQVHEVLAPLSQGVGLRAAAVYGGADIERQVARLRKGVDVIIATPGRLIDLGDRGELTVADVEILVLDEADRMADMGFMPQVEWVLRRLERRHQTLLFSATLDGAVDRLVARYLSDPVHHEVASTSQTVTAMEHRFLQVHQMDKVKVAASICRPRDKVLVFVRTKRGADRLVEQLAKERIRAAAIHGDLRQANRERALADFASGKLHVLVATDVAARGLHIEGVDVVIHYDPPEDHKAYLHRSGRTARAGSTGVVATLVLWNQVVEAEVIQRRLGLRLPIVEIFSNDPRLGDLAGWVPSPGDGVL